MKKSMRHVTYERYGTPDVLTVSSTPRPRPGSGQVLVRVTATTVNGGEIAGRQGRLKLVTGKKFPRPVGIDFTGQIVELGQGVSHLTPQDLVWGTVDERGSIGSAADYVVIDQDRVFRAPNNLPLLEAASLLSGGTTALAALRDTVSLKPTEQVLVRGAAGGVGSVAVQIAKALGARVTALVSETSFKFVRDLGADEVVDYRTAANELEKFDVIFDTRGTQLAQFRSLLSKRGRMVTIAFDLDHPARSLAYIGFSTVYGSRRVRLFLGHPNASLLSSLTEMTEAGKLRPVVDSVYSLEQIADAHTRLEAGGVHGKVVVRVGTSSTK